jgi:hypothetical protein
LHLEHEIRAGERGLGRTGDLGARLLEGLVRDRSAGAGILLEQNLGAQCNQFSDCFR